MNEQRIDKIREQLNLHLQPTHLNIIDDSERHKNHPGAQDGRGHFIVEIAAPDFNQQSLVTCHRMVYQALEKLLQTDIHALNIKVLE